MNSPNSRPNRASRRTPPDPLREIEIVSPGGRCIRATASNLMIAMAQHRSEETALAKEAASARQRRLAAARADREAALEVMRELERDYRHHLRFAVRVRMKPQSANGNGEGNRPSIRISPASHRPSPGTSGWEIDEAGFRGVHYQQTYMGRNSPSFKPGCARQGFLYIARDDAMLADGHGEPLIFSNVGQTMDEMANAWDAIEASSTRKNAKIQIEAIVAFDAEAGPDEQVAALRTFLETVFEPLDIPYTAAMHAPSPDGDQRNIHAHILFNLRPMRRVADNEWGIADSIVRELDGKAGVTALRHLWAHAQTLAAEQTGRDIDYTALSYANRGLDRAPGEHLGPARSAQARRGQPVPAALRNRRKADINRLRRQLTDIDGKMSSLVRIKAALEQRMSARVDHALPALPGSPEPRAITLPQPPVVGIAPSMPPKLPLPLGRLDFPQVPVARVQPVPPEAPLPMSAIPEPRLPLGPLDGATPVAGGPRGIMPPPAPADGIGRIEIPTLPDALMHNLSSMPRLPVLADHGPPGIPALRLPVAMPDRIGSGLEHINVPSPPEPVSVTVALPRNLSAAPDVRLPARPALAPDVSSPGVSGRMNLPQISLPRPSGHIDLARLRLPRTDPDAPLVAPLVAPPPLGRAVSFDKAQGAQMLAALKYMTALFAYAERKEAEGREEAAKREATGLIVDNGSVPTGTEPPHIEQEQSSFADGFGGRQATPPPTHVPMSAGALRIPALMQGSEPSLPFKKLLYCLGRHPEIAEYADDSLLTIPPAARTFPGAHEAAFFLHCWRDDPQLHDAMVEVVRRARANEGEPWPAQYTEAMRRFARQIEREDERPAERHAISNRPPWMERDGRER